jgi:hypothetical protein
MEFIVREILEREIEAEDCVEAEQMYSNEDVVLDYNDLVYSEVVPKSNYTIILMDAKDGTVIMYHLQSKPNDIECWLSNNYANFDSNCSWMETTKEVDHVYTD